MTNFEKEQLAIARATLSLVNWIAEAFAPMTKSRAAEIVRQYEPA